MQADEVALVADRIAELRRALVVVGQVVRQVLVAVRRDARRCRRGTRTPRRRSRWWPGSSRSRDWPPYCQKMNGSSSTANSSARSSPRIAVNVASARMRVFIASRRASAVFWKSFSFCRHAAIGADVLEEHEVAIRRRLHRIGRDSRSARRSATVAVDVVGEEPAMEQRRHAALARAGREPLAAR